MTSSGLMVTSLAPEGGAHDGGDDLHAGGEVFEVFGFVGGAEDVGVGGVGLLGGHLVVEAGLDEELGHFLAAAELVDELRRRARACRP